MMDGQIVKGIAGFYFVKSGETIYRCRARGIFKKQGMKPLVGDMVRFDAPRGEDEGLVREILPRKNSFIRPAVANVDRIVIVTAAAGPDPVLQTIDKLLVTAEKAQTDPVICINKCDLASSPKAREREKASEAIEELRKIYSGIYPVICTSRGDEESLKELREYIRGKAVALAGASGVGKSTILNRLLEKEHMETGVISEKTSRGKHTTRHVELFTAEGEGTGIFDTPGFTSFDIPQMEAVDIGGCFPEINRLASGCRYDDCLHIAEPECAVKQALEREEISRSRYESYCAFVKEAQTAKDHQGGNR